MTLALCKSRKENPQKLTQLSSRSPPRHLVGKRTAQKDIRVVLGWAYRGLTGGFLLLQNFSVAISVSPHVCFILVLILISMFLR